LSAFIACEASASAAVAAAGVMLLSVLNLP
jgi:hypothetical protein